LWRIAAADVSSNNRVRLLRDGPATFDAMLELIEQARTSLALESYIFRSDEVGRRFGDALTRAAGRGGAVRVLLDWIGARGGSGGARHGGRVRDDVASHGRTRAPGLASVSPSSSARIAPRSIDAHPSARRHRRGGAASPARFPRPPDSSHFSRAFDLDRNGVL